jgi:hypothetical protein
MAPETTMTEAADTFGNASGFSLIAARRPDELPDTPLLGVEVVARKTVRVAFSGELDMVQARQHCAENGGLLVLTDPRPLLRHVLAITGLTHLLLDR